LAKKKEGLPSHRATRGQLSQWQRQQKRQRLIFIAGITIVVVVFITIGLGWLLSVYLPLNETIIRVNDTEFNMNFYVQMLQFYGPTQPDIVVERIQQNELIKLGAQELGIIVNNQEVDEELNRFDPPLSKDFREPIRVELLITKLLEEYFESQVPQSTEQRHVLAMFLESESQVREILDRLDNGETFQELAAELSLDNFTQSQKGDLGWHPEGVFTLLLGSSLPTEFAFTNEAGTLSGPLFDENKSKPVGYWIITIMERNEDTNEVRLGGILVGNEVEVNQVKNRLDMDESFVDLANELSLLNPEEDNDGDLGWFSEDSMYPLFSDFVSNSEERYSEPIRDGFSYTQGGYWLVRVLGVDIDKRIIDDDRVTLKRQAFDDWLAALLSDTENEFEVFLDEDKKTWAIERATRELT
jgi:parvulin-like peptidyl-prolyl isomerase